MRAPVAGASELLMLHKNAGTKLCALDAREWVMLLRGARWKTGEV